MCTDKLHRELDRINFVTVTIDASNTKEVKLVPIVIRYFLPESGVEVKLLQFKSVPRETAEILTLLWYHGVNMTPGLFDRLNIPNF